MDYPHLIENSAKNYLYHTLQQCHSNRVVIYYYVLNISVFVIFVGTIATVLYYCNTHKLTDYEKQQKLVRDQQYVLSKIRYYQEEKKASGQSSITSLPMRGTYGIREP